MKKLNIILLILILNTFVYAEAQKKDYNLQTEAITTFDLRNPGIGWEIGNKIFINGSKDISIDLLTTDKKYYDYSTELSSIRGLYGNNLIVGRVEENNNNQDFVLYVYKPAENTYIRLNKIFVNIDNIGKLNNIFYFYNSLYIASYASNEDYIFYNTYLVNEETGELTKLLEYTKVYDISPDKMNLLVVSYNENYIGIYNIEKKEVVKKIKFSGDPAFDDSLYFIDNDNFFLLSCETGQEIGHIMNLNMETLIDIHYLKPTDVPNIGLSLSTIMKAHYGYYTQGGGKRILVKMPGEQEIYEENNLFFHPTTATLNDDRVRMREWPLLDAKHIAFLEKGEKVEVLDRSGIRVKIGDMNDYWYKLRRSDGTEGWSYGYFLDLAAE